MRNILSAARAAQRREAAQKKAHWFVQPTIRSFDLAHLAHWSC